MRADSVRPLKSKTDASGCCVAVHSPLLATRCATKYLPRGCCCGSGQACGHWGASGGRHSGATNLDVPLKALVVLIVP